MRFKIISVLVLSSFMLLTNTDTICQLTSGNPIIKHIRTADPSAQVWEDHGEILDSRDVSWGI